MDSDVLTRGEVITFFVTVATFLVALGVISYLEKYLDQQAVKRAINKNLKGNKRELK